MEDGKEESRVRELLGAGGVCEYGVMTVPTDTVSEDLGRCAECSYAVMMELVARTCNSSPWEAEAGD